MLQGEVVQSKKPHLATEKPDPTPASGSSVDRMELLGPTAALVPAGRGSTKRTAGHTHALMPAGPTTYVRGGAGTNSLSRSTDTLSISH